MLLYSLTLVALLPVVPCFGSEPACSKYDYEEKLLERIIKAQFDVQQFSIALETMKKEIDIFKTSSAAQFAEEKSDFLSWRNSVEEQIDLWRNESIETKQTINTMLTETRNQIQSSSTELKDERANLTKWRQKTDDHLNASLEQINDTLLQSMTDLMKQHQGENIYNIVRK